MSLWVILIQPELCLEPVRNITINWGKFSKKTTQKIYKDRFEVVKSLQIKGVTNITVPIFDFTNSAVAALTIPFVDRIIANELNIKQVTNLLVSYGKKLSFNMGYRGK